MGAYTSPGNTSEKIKLVPSGPSHLGKKTLDILSPLSHKDLVCPKSL